MPVRNSEEHVEERGVIGELAAVVWDGSKTEVCLISVYEFEENDR